MKPIPGMTLSRSADFSEAFGPEFDPIKYGKRTLKGKSEEDVVLIYSACIQELTLEQPLHSFLKSISSLSPIKKVWALQKYRAVHGFENSGRDDDLLLYVFTVACGFHPEEKRFERALAVAADPSLVFDSTEVSDADSDDYSPAFPPEASKALQAQHEDSDSGPEEFTNPQHPAEALMKKKKIELPYPEHSETFPRHETSMIISAQKSLQYIHDKAKEAVEETPEFRPAPMQMGSFIANPGPSTLSLIEKSDIIREGAAMKTAGITSQDGTPVDVRSVTPNPQFTPADWRAIHVLYGAIKPEAWKMLITVLQTNRKVRRDMAGKKVIFTVTDGEMVSKIPVQIGIKSGVKSTDLTPRRAAQFAAPLLVDFPPSGALYLAIGIDLLISQSEEIRKKLDTTGYHKQVKKHDLTRAFSLAGWGYTANNPIELDAPLVPEACVVVGMLTELRASVTSSERGTKREGDNFLVQACRGATFSEDMTLQIARLSIPVVESRVTTIGRTPQALSALLSDWIAKLKL
ncbi:nucleoprotein [Wenling hagfish virus]|uniref:Nucleoprotein n=1 Tax=Wenling hagfish virus TaxID=2116438 RepID=A0A2P1GNT9_9VIRU|nr:nucleoprotein [Wenling hagfish virus]